MSDLHWRPEKCTKSFRRWACRILKEQTWPISNQVKENDHIVDCQRESKWPFSFAGHINRWARRDGSFTATKWTQTGWVFSSVADAQEQNAITAWNIPSSVSRWLLRHSWHIRWPHLRSSCSSSWEKEDPYIKSRERYAHSFKFTDAVRQDASVEPVPVSSGFYKQHTWLSQRPTFPSIASYSPLLPETSAEKINRCRVKSRTHKIVVTFSIGRRARTWHTSCCIR